MSLQIFVNALVNAALIAPPAMAFSLLFGILRFPNFAIGGYITVGAFTAYSLNVSLGLPLALAAAGAMAVHWPCRLDRSCVCLSPNGEPILSHASGGFHRTDINFGEHRALVLLSRCSRLRHPTRAPMEILGRTDYN